MTKPHHPRALPFLDKGEDSTRELANEMMRECHARFEFKRRHGLTRLKCLTREPPMLTYDVVKSGREFAYIIQRFEPGSKTATDVGAASNEASAIGYITMDWMIQRRLRYP